MDNKDADVRSFSEVLKFYGKQMGYKTSGMYDIIKKQNIGISKSSFYDYARGSAVPSYEKARKILIALDISIKDPNMISEILEASKHREIYLESQGNINYALQGTYSVPWLSIFREATTGLEARELMNKRVNEVAKSMPDYISKLIRKDLEEHILTAKESEVNYHDR